MLFVLFLNSHNIRFLSLILSLPNSYKTIVAIHFRTIFSDKYILTSNPIKYKKQLHPLIYAASETAPVSSL